MVGLETLPLACCLRAFAYLTRDSRDLRSLAAVCSRLNVIASMDPLWVAAFTLRDVSRSHRRAAAAVVCWSFRRPKASVSAPPRPQRPPLPQSPSLFHSHCCWWRRVSSSRCAAALSCVACSGRRTSRSIRRCFDACRSPRCTLGRSPSPPTRHWRTAVDAWWTPTRRLLATAGSGASLCCAAVGSGWRWTRATPRRCASGASSTPTASE
jgi:hypothetical protein